MMSNWGLFLGAGAVIGALVLGLILFPLVRWRRRANDAAPPQFRNSYAIEIAWTAIPLLIVGGLFVATYAAEARIDAVADRPAVTVAVDAYRWGWTFAYRNGPTVGGPSQGPAEFGVTPPRPELVLPVGETTRIELSAADVDHGFWVPAFLFKRDAIPGQTTAFDIRPTTIGLYAGRCSAFCGLQHANMRFDVRVLTREQFVAWERAKT